MISYYHPRHTEVRRPHETCCERALRRVGFDHHAYSTAATQRPTATLIVQNVPRTYLISLESCRIDQDIIQSSSAHRRHKQSMSRAARAHNRLFLPVCRRPAHDSPSWHLAYGPLCDCLDGWEPHSRQIRDRTMRQQDCCKRPRWRM